MATVHKIEMRPPREDIPRPRAAWKPGVDSRMSANVRVAATKVVSERAAIAAAHAAPTGRDQLKNTTNRGARHRPRSSAADLSCTGAALRQDRLRRNTCAGAARRDGAPG
jgi:hypothetical protein